MADGYVTREEIHHRRIDMRGFRRSDGLYEVEGRVTDRKPFDFRPGGDGEIVPADQGIHDTGVRLVFDEHMVVRDVSTFMDATPYPACLGGGLALRSMVGVRIGGGWSKEGRRAELRTFDGTADPDGDGGDPVVEPGTEQQAGPAR